MSNPGPSNLTIIQRLFDANWTTKWVETEPGWILRNSPQDRKHLSGDYILYWETEQQANPVDYQKQFVNRRHEFHFLCQSTTKGNPALMVEELEYILRNNFYPAPWYPRYNSADSAILCHLDCNEGTGTTVYDSTENDYDFAFGAGAEAPAWVTTGAIHQKNYIRFSPADNMTQATLMDTVPSGVTWEAVVSIVSGGNDIGRIVKQTSSEVNSFFAHFFTSPPGHVSWNVNVSPIIEVLLGGKMAFNRWTKFMATAGPRGRELYVNGILTSSTTTTTLPPGGTYADFRIDAWAGDTWELCRFRVSSVQRLPYDTLYITRVGDLVERKGLYQKEVTIIGEQQNVYLGGNV